jgi:hypothetical protein
LVCVSTPSLSFRYSDLFCIPVYSGDCTLLEIQF